MKIRARFALLLLLIHIGLWADLCMNVTPTRAALRHREARGVGYEDGYTTAAFFATPNWERLFQPFLDFRAHLMNDGRFASNVGLGARFCSDSESDWIWGGNFYYDYRSALHLSPHQIGLGLEGLSPWVDFRLNGYIPIGQKDKIGSLEPGPMQSRTVVVQQNVTATLGNIQGEIGVPIGGIFKVVDLYFGLGPYYLFERSVLCRDFGGALGGQARLTAQLFDGVEAGILGTYDRLFHGTFQGYLSLSFPLGSENLRTQGSRWKKRYKNCQKKALLQRRMVQNTERAEIIPMQQSSCRSVPLNPFTQQPYRLIFVNNTSPYPGDGTYKFPYNSLALAESNSAPGEVIYLLYNNGYTPGASSGITLKARQTLQGSGNDLYLDSQLVLPAVTPGLLPTVTGDGVAAVTLAEGSSVIGINFLNWTSRAIDGSSAGSYTIKLNRFLNNGVNSGHALYGDGAPAGTKIIVGNVFNTNIEKEAAGLNDLSLRNLTDSTILIADNAFDCEGFSAMTLHVTDCSTRIVNNTIVQNLSPAMIVTANGDGSTVFFENNHLSATGGANSLLFVTRSGSVDFDMRNNEFINDSTHHIQMTVGPIVTDTASVKALFDRNRFTSQAIALDRFELGASSSTFCLELNRNTTDGIFQLINNSLAADYQVASTNNAATGVSEQNNNASILFSPSVADFTFVPIGTCN